MSTAPTVSPGEAAPPAVALPRLAPVDGAPPPPLRLKGVVLAGLAVFLAFFGLFGGWAALAPLDSAVVATGFVKVEGQRKTVQHLEGGIVGALLVADGDLVHSGDVLLQLDDTQPRARLELLEGRWLARQALAARLRAERDGLDSIALPPRLVDQAHRPAAADAIASQSSVFDARRRAVRDETAVLHQRIAQSREEITGLEADIAAQGRQIALIAEEVDDLEDLFAKGLTPRERLLALKRRAAEIEGERARNRAAVARARKSIAETEQRIIELNTRRHNQVVEQLSEVEAELFDLEQQSHAARDVLGRIDLKAPVDGVVVGLRIHTAGGVIRPGEPVLDLVPVGEELVIEARVRPEDIDVVHGGQDAQVRITAFSQRDLPALNGEVETVSADSLTDERSGTSYYLAQVRVSEREVEKLAGASLLPGMPAEVMIRTGARSLVDYLLEPFLRTLRRSMRET